MKLAVLADIHANYAALEAVAAHIDHWRPDAVVVAGDIVNRGPQPLECLRFVEERRHHNGWQVIMGNHEEYLLHFMAGHSQLAFANNDLRREMLRSVEWTCARIEPHLPTIAELPRHLRLESPDGALAWVTHASIRGNRDGIYAEAPDEELSSQIVGEAQLFCVGHTHVPFARRLGQTLVVNCGAVGLPFDGDTRASYTQLTWHAGYWHAEIVRLPYDRLATERAFLSSGLMEAMGPMGRLMLRELQTGRSMIFTFIPHYQQPVMSGTLSLDAAVAACLAEEDSPHHSFRWGASSAPAYLTR